MNPIELIPLVTKSRVVRDVFNRTLAANNGKGFGSTDTGQPWTAYQQKSTMAVDPALGAFVTSAATFAIAGVDLGVSDVDETLVFGAMNGTSSGTQGAAIRIQDISNFIYVRFGTTATAILTRVAGTYTVRASANKTLTAGDVLRVSMIGANITVMVNGEPYLYWTDTAGAGGGQLFPNVTNHGFVLANSASRLRSIILSPLANIAPANRDLTFTDRFSSNDLSNYSTIFHKETISFLDDPIGTGRRVIRMDVPNTAIGPTANPRCQMSPPPVLFADTEVWAGFAVMFPSGTGPTAGVTAFPSMPTGASGFMNITQFYTSDPESSATVKLGFRAGGGRELFWQRNATYNNDRPWRLGADVQLDKWYEFVHHVVFSADTSIGYVEMFMRTSTAGGWVQQTFFPGTAQETQRLYMKTLDPIANTNGPQRHDIQLYRSVDMFSTVSIYFTGHRVGYTFPSADPGYY